MDDIEVKLNWFERHLNWTFGLVSVITIATVYWCFLSFRASWAPVLGIFIVLVFVSTGLWVLIMKGRGLFWGLIALWPFIPAIVMSVLYQSRSIWRSLDSMLISLLILLTGATINIIVVLLFKNAKYKQTVLNENGKLVKRWDRIGKPNVK